MFTFIAMKGICMVLNRARKNRIVLCTVAMIGLVAFAGVVSSMSGPAWATRMPSGSERQAVGSSERLRELMTERYEIHKSIVETLDKSIAAGRIGLAEWRDARVAMYAAKADLCTQTAERLEVYEEMVDFLRTAEEQARRRAKAGVAGETEVRQTRLATIDALMALERLRLVQPR